MSDLDKTGAILESCKRDLFLHIKGIKSKLGRNGTFSHSDHNHGQNRTEQNLHHILKATYEFDLIFNHC